MVHRVDTACRHLGPGHAVKVKDTTGIVLIQTESRHPSLGVGNKRVLG